MPRKEKKKRKGKERRLINYGRITFILLRSRKRLEEGNLVKLSEKDRRLTLNCTSEKEAI